MLGRQFCGGAGVLEGWTVVTRLEGLLSGLEKCLRLCEKGRQVGASAISDRLGSVE